MARVGKIARLPHELREQINLRLLNNETSAIILAWLNQQPEAIKIWEAHFEGMPASAENLSVWRQGEYQKWIGRRERVEDLKTLSTFAHSIASTGGDLADGAAAIVAGHLVEALENIGNIVVTGGSKDEDNEGDPLKGLATIASAVASIQKSSTGKQKLMLDRERVRQKDAQLALDREKYETATVKMFLKWAREPEVAAILDSGKSKEVQMDQLHELLFGQNPFEN